VTATEQATPAVRSVLSRLQQGLESLYRVETRLDVDAFIVGDSERGRALSENEEARRPREQLLVEHAAGEVALGLYVDAEALQNLERHDPVRGLGEHNFGDFCLAVEGVSHFIYVALCAASDRSVSALELELQAEVDKFVTCLLLGAAVAQRSRRLRARLYDDIRFADDLDGSERARYVTANDQARRYAIALERHYLQHERIADMLAELRRFYRLSLGAKLGHIARATAA
jgi:hypothetical protein